MLMDKKTVTSDQGFTVHRDDVFTLSYREGDHVFKFGLELYGNQQEYNFILYSDSSLSRGWQAPFDEEPLEPARKQEILKRVLAAVQLMGKKAMVV